jgi:hypothetical protein
MKANEGVLGVVFSVMAVFFFCAEPHAMKLMLVDLHQFVSLSVELHSVTYHNLNVDHYVNFISCFHSRK